MNSDFKLDRLPVRKAGRRAGLAAPSSRPNLPALPQLPAACCPLIWTRLQSVRASLTICPLVTRSPLVPGSFLFLCRGVALSPPSTHTKAATRLPGWNAAGAGTQRPSHADQQPTHQCSHPPCPQQGPESQGRCSGHWDTLAFQRTLLS